ncbi:hypothetical protein IIB79_12205 [candidate division KSB1 bacterium]|nr:hypothetical protein [candidate division KSB1 bacterium]
MYNRKLNLMTVIIAVVLVAAFIPGTGDYAVSQSITSGNSIDREQLSALMSWRNIGPARGGRSTAVAGSVTDENLYYFGATGGGVWKTTDGGENWRSIGDEITVGSIGDIDISRSNSNIVFVGTGEACFRGNISHGNGVYKSVDGGNSWQHVGLTESRYIPRLLIHPENDDIIFVAAIGHLYAPPGSYRGDHGVFRSKDGGETWENVLPGVNNQTGAVDISISHRNPNVMFAALYETFRTPYSSSSGGPGSGLYKSADGGDTWTKVEGGGFPGGILGKIGVSISPADNNRVYAMVEAEDGGLYRSDDGGETWTLTNNDRDKRQRNTRG